MKADDQERDRIFLKLYLKSSPGEVTDEELSYFREHPDQIDEVTAPVNVHKLFLGRYSAGHNLCSCIQGAQVPAAYFGPVRGHPGIRESTSFSKPGSL